MSHSAPINPNLPPVSREERLKAQASMILSASGWRKVFANDQDENSLSPFVLPADRLLCGLVGQVFADFLTDRSNGGPIRVALGRDSRFTGQVISQDIATVLEARNCMVEDFGILPIPQLMAHVQLSQRYQGFLYVSASHNPAGHNGIKLGTGSGGVLGGIAAQNLIEAFRQAVLDESLCDRTRGILNGAQKATPEFLPDRHSFADTLSSYSELTDRIWFGTGRATAKEKKKLQASCVARNLGMVIDFNGSARCLGLDRKYLETLGIKVHTLHDQAGDFSHAIIPEGESLQECAQELERLHGEDPAFTLGFVPDCDGDRGNLVYWDEVEQCVRVPEAQEIFALSVLSELCLAVESGALSYDDEGYPRERWGIVCNGPTSLRVNEIAQAFRVNVFRGEVGEANMVELANKLRAEDWIIRILGEGSNGGNITHPALVRDPINTLGALVKFYALRGTGDQPGPFEIWCRRSGQAYKGDFTWRDIFQSLPAYQTTPVSSSRAQLKLSFSSPAALKRAFETLFTRRGWPENSLFLKEQFGICTWEEVNYEGSNCRRGFGPPFRSGKESGGLALMLKDCRGQECGFIWMRNSGTEPVFRLMADIKGSDAFAEEWLLQWLSAMVREAGSLS